MNLLVSLAPILIMAVVVVVIIWLRVATIRLNKKLRQEGKPPVDEGPPIVNVIDWTRRK